jgi:competence/damage-inducible protein cinA C-terminal domain
MEESVEGDELMEIDGMEAQIIAVGTELTIGQVLDTNSNYLSQSLDALGVRVVGIQVIPDDRVTMRRVFEESVAKYDFTIVTGGLGPTDDDFTKFVLRDMFGGDWKEDAASLAAIIDYFSQRGAEASPRNLAQASVPSSCDVLFNRLGTAPGMLFRRGDHFLISLPGVPFEMKALFAERVEPLIMSKSNRRNFHRTLQIYGIAESDLADRLRSWEASLSPEFSLAYLPSLESIRLRISAKGEANRDTEVHAESKVRELRNILGPLLFGEGDESLADVVGKLLVAKKASVAIAESCTGGGVCKSLVSVPGASLYVRGGIVAYSNAIKERLLGVAESEILDCGAASGEVAEAMAEGARKLMDADYAVSTTGVLGPQGDGSCTPIGTVWVSVSGPLGVSTKMFRVRSSREIGMALGVSRALNELRLYLLREE